jgi:hypothetical protein
VIAVEQADLDTISEIVAKYGYIEWTLIGFTPERDYNIFSYFTDPSVLPVFKAVLLSIFKTLSEYIEKNQYYCEQSLHTAGAGSC